MSSFQGVGIEESTVSVFSTIFSAVLYDILYSCRIYDIELRLNTPLKFRHPCYEALMWFAAENYLTEVQGEFLLHVFVDYMH